VEEELVEQIEQPGKVKDFEIIEESEFLEKLAAAEQTEIIGNAEPVNTAKPIEPDNVSALFRIANSYLKIAKYEKAIQFFIKCVEKGARNHKLFNNLGYAYYFLQKFENARNEVQKAIEIDGDYSYAKQNLEIIINRLKTDTAT
jgi:tetratricopeptide (TPR) repeat protein